MKHTQDKINELTERLTQLDYVLKGLGNPEDVLYQDEVQCTYAQVLRDRSLLIKKLIEGKEK